MTALNSATANKVSADTAREAAAGHRRRQHPSMSSETVSRRSRILSLVRAILLPVGLVAISTMATAANQVTFTTSTISMPEGFYFGIVAQNFGAGGTDDIGLAGLDNGGATEFGYWQLPNLGADTFDTPTDFAGIVEGFTLAKGSFGGTAGNDLVSVASLTTGLTINYPSSSQNVVQIAQFPGAIPGTVVSSSAIPGLNGPVAVSPDSTYVAVTTAATASSGSDSVVVLEPSLSGMTPSVPIVATVSVGAVPIAITFTANGDIAVQTCNGESGAVSILTGSGNSWMVAGTYNVGKCSVGLPQTPGGGIVSANFRGAGNPPDLVVSNNANGTLSYLTSQGGSSYTVTSTLAVGNGPAAVVATDFDGDGNLDIAEVNQTDRTVDVLLGNGTGAAGFTSAIIVPVGNASGFLTVGNFAGNGEVDLAETNTDSSITVLIDAVTPTTVSVVPAQTSLTVTSGQSTSTNVTLTSKGGLTGNVTVSCSISWVGTGAAPTAVPSCTASPTQVTLSSGGTATVALNINTHSSGTAAAALGGLFLLLPWVSRRKRSVAVAGLCLTLVGLISCGGSDHSGGSSTSTSTGVNAGTGAYQVVFKATSGSTTVTSNISLTVQ